LGGGGFSRFREREKAKDRRGGHIEYGLRVVRGKTMSHHKKETSEGAKVNHFTKEMGMRGIPRRGGKGALA